MNEHVIPEPIGNLLGHLPVMPGSLMFVGALNAIVAPRLGDDVKEKLLGKQLRLVMTDAKLHFNFVWVRGGFVPGNDNVEPDLTISASAWDFYLLSKREEDPDTLFFTRRLVMEGDTDLGVMIKNSLDAMELNVVELMKTATFQKIMSVFKRPANHGGVNA